MFNDTDNGQTQYCPMCLEWAEENKKLKAENVRLSELTCVNCGEKFLSPTGSELYEKIVQLKAENEELKSDIEARIMCIQCKRENENYKLKVENEKMKQALEEVREECKCYGRQTGSNREYDRDYGGELHINIIEKINEVFGRLK